MSSDSEYLIDFSSCLPGRDNEAMPTQNPDRARPANTIHTSFAHAINSHDIMKGIAVERIVFFLPKYSMKGPPVKKEKIH